MTVFSKPHHLDKLLHVSELWSPDRRIFLNQYINKTKCGEHTGLFEVKYFSEIIIVNTYARKMKFVFNLWPLLLTWLNFNPNMVK